MSYEEETVINRNTMKLQDHLYKALKQRDQYKAERDKLENMLNKECECGFQMEGKYRDMKAERDTLNDDLPVLKADNEKYKKRAENAMDYAERSQCEVLRLEQENKDLRLQADTYFDEWQKSQLKAQAFDRIDEVYGDSDLYSDEYVLETIQEQIDRLEQK